MYYHFLLYYSAIMSQILNITLLNVKKAKFYSLYSILFKFYPSILYHWQVVVRALNVNVCPTQRTKITTRQCTLNYSRHIIQWKDKFEKSLVVTIIKLLWNCQYNDSRGKHSPVLHWAWLQWMPCDMAVSHVWKSCIKPAKYLRTGHPSMTFNWHKHQK